MEEKDDLYTVEAAIKSRNQKLADLKEKMKKLNEMLNDYLDSDEEYLKLKKEAKDASAKKSRRRQDLLSKPEAQGIPDKIQEAKDFKRELEESISMYLAKYQQLSGTNEFEDENGELKQIVYVAKLVKRSGGK